LTGISALGFDLILAALILGAGLFAITVRDLFGAVVFFIVYSVFVAIAWLRLGAIDVALTEAALGAGLTGVLLIGAVARLARVTTPAGDETAPAKGPNKGSSHEMRIVPLSARLASMAVAGTISGVLGWAFLSLPDSTGLRDAVADNLAVSGVTNPVTAVLMNFRGWDTLLESVVLLAALVGLWSLARDTHWGRRAGLRQHARAGGVMATFGRLLPPFGLLLGVYLVWAGSSYPGGAFQGGTVLAAVWLLVMMAGLMPAPRMVSVGLRGVLVAGPLVFLGIGIAGAITGTFLGLPPAFAKPLILTIEAALTLSIAATLAPLVLGTPDPSP
jgi:multisubunit Na+/H+ antiporter MnhB subunit